jgi:outer membrane protein assembly factor BamB
MPFAPALLLGLLLGSLAQEPPDLGTRKAGVDWPGFLGPDHDGTSPETGLSPTWPREGPRLVWQRDLGEGYAAASVQKGRLYHFDRQDGRYRLRCLKSETGEDLWKFEYESDYRDSYGAGNGPRCCPVVDGDRVYTFDPAGLLHCVRAADGGVVWKKDTSKEFGVVPNFFGVGSTPIVDGDLLIAMIGGSPPNSPDIGTGETRGQDSGIVAFDKRSGAVKYRISDELASYSSPLIKTIGDRKWGFAYARNGLLAFDPVAGKVEFHHPWRARSITTVNICNPVVAGDLVFVSEAYGVGSSVVRLKPGGFTPVWEDGRKRDRALMAYWNTPIHAGGHLYGSNGMGSDADLRCVEMATGALKWSAPELRQCSLMAVDGHFVALSEDGVLRLIKIRPERCEVVAETTLKGKDGANLIEAPARAAPILSHGLLYVRGSSRLVCLDLIPAK